MLWALENGQRELRISATKHDATGLDDNKLLLLRPAKGEVSSLDIPFYRTRLLLRRELPDRSLVTSTSASGAIDLPARIQLQVPEIVAGEADQVLVLMGRP